MSQHLRHVFKEMFLSSNNPPMSMKIVAGGNFCALFFPFIKYYAKCLIFVHDVLICSGLYNNSHMTMHNFEEEKLQSHALSLILLFFMNIKSRFDWKCKSIEIQSRNQKLETMDNCIESECLNKTIFRSLPHFFKKTGFQSNATWLNPQRGNEMIENDDERREENQQYIIMVGNRRLLLTGILVTSLCNFTRTSTHFCMFVW